MAELHNLRFLEFGLRNAVERNIKSYSFILITNSNLLLLVFHFFSFNVQTLSILRKAKRRHESFKNMGFSLLIHR